MNAQQANKILEEILEICEKDPAALEYFREELQKIHNMDTVQVEIELTINTDGEWVAYGDNRPTQNTWHNSTRYKIIANIPKPTTKTIHATEIHKFTNHNKAEYDKLQASDPSAHLM